MAAFRRILITGSGQLGSALLTAAPAGADVLLLGHQQLDVGDNEAVAQAVAGFGPDLLLHTAALTRVSYCETHLEEATRINANGTANVLAAARQSAARMVYFSTDYVFSGLRPGLRLEDEQPAPLNIYGASKAIVEPLVLAQPDTHVIRISGVFGPRSDGREEQNFVRSIYQRLHAGQTTSVVNDQWTALTYAPYLAQMVFGLLTSGPAPGLPRIAHLVCEGSDSWFGWASQIARICGFDQDLLLPISAAQYQDQTPRPRFSTLGSREPGLQQLISDYPASRGLSEYLQLLNLRHD